MLATRAIAQDVSKCHIHSEATAFYLREQVAARGRAVPCRQLYLPLLKNLLVLNTTILPTIWSVGEKASF